MLFGSGPSTHVIGIVTRALERRENPGGPQHHTWGAWWTGWVPWAVGRGGALCRVLQAPVILSAPGPLACLLGLENACERVPCGLGRPFPGG